MEEDIVTLETARMANEKGFDELCYYSYEGSSLHKTFKPKKNSDDSTEIAAPTHALLQKWLRENFKIYCQAVINIMTERWGYEIFIMSRGFDITYNDDCDKWDLLSYEQAMDYAIYEALKLL